MSYHSIQLYVTRGKLPVKQWQYNEGRQRANTKCQQDTMQKIYTGNRWDHKYVWNVESIYQCTLTSKCVSSSRRNRNIHTNIVSFYPFRSIWHNNMDTGWESAIHSRVTVFVSVCVCGCVFYVWLRRGWAVASLVTTANETFKSVLSVLRLRHLAV